MYRSMMQVILSYFLGFGRQMAMGIQVQAANAILGSQNLVAVLGADFGGCGKRFYKYNQGHCLFCLYGGARYSCIAFCYSDVKI